MTVEPISIKISDAIMNFQESGFQVAADFNQLNNKCLSTLPEVHPFLHQIQFPAKANHQFLAQNYYFPVNSFPPEFEPNVDFAQS